MYKIFTLVFFLTSIGSSALFLKEKNLSIFKDDSMVQRQVMKIAQDDIFQKAGFSSLAVDFNEMGFDSYQTKRASIGRPQAGTRLFFISKAPIENLVKIQDIAVEVFQDDFAKKLIDAGKSAPDFLKWQEKSKNIMFSDKSVINGAKAVQLDDGRVVVLFNSAAGLSVGADEIYAQAQLKYSAVNVAAPVIEKEALIAKEGAGDVAPNADAVSADAAISANSSNIVSEVSKGYELTFEDQKIKLEPNWYNGETSSFKIISDLSFIEIILFDDKGVRVAGELMGDKIQIAKKDGVLPNISKAKLKYKILADKEIQLSQTYIIGQ